MKILLMSRWGDGLDSAIDGKRWGHQVKCWIQDPKRRHTIYEGLVDKVEDWKQALEWSDLVIFDAGGMSKEWEYIVKKRPAFGGNTEAEKMEKDRNFAHKLFKEAGMSSYESVTFKNISEAKEHLKTHKIFHVSKLVGGDADSQDILISEREDGQDCIDLMEIFEEQGKKCDLIEIEERILGIEVGCAGYFNGSDWIGPIEISFQHKEIASGRKGSSRGMGMLCGESGTSILYVDSNNKFFKKTLGLFTEHFKKIGMRGETDLGTMTNSDGIFPIEWTNRWGYPDRFIRRSLTKTSDFELFKAVAEGKKLNNFSTLPGWATGYLVMVPGFPSQDAVEEESSGYPVFGYDESNPNMHLQEVTKGKRGIEIAKGCGYTAVISGRGDTIEDSQKSAMWLYDERNPDRLYIPKSWIRSDVGDRIINQKKQIIDLGILTEEEFGG